MYSYQKNPWKSMPEYSRQEKPVDHAQKNGTNYPSQEIKQQIPCYQNVFFSEISWISVPENNRKNHSRQEKTSKLSLGSPPDCLFFPELPLGISTSKSSSQNIQSRMHYYSKLGTTLYSLTCIHLFYPCKYTL